MSNKAFLLEPYVTDMFAMCICYTWIAYHTKKTKTIICHHCGREYENKNGELEMIKPGILD